MIWKRRVRREDMPQKISALSASPRFKPRQNPNPINFETQRHRDHRGSTEPKLRVLRASVF